VIGRHRAAVAAVTAVALCVAFAPAAAADGIGELESIANLPWPALLPPLPVTTNVQPHPVPHCAQVSIDCVAATVERLRSLRDQLGCDHRAIFASTYMLLQQQLLDDVRRDPTLYTDPAWLPSFVDVHFVNYYFSALADLQAGRPLPEAWRIAFDAAKRGEINAGQDMLAAINAHVQRDMPFVLAEMGLRTPDGSSRKVDHDRFNDTLQRAYQRVVDAIGRRYDPLITVTNAGWNVAGAIGGLELIKYWREGVWRNAERLLNARTPAEQRQVAQSIEDNAAAWARAITTFQTPGYRAQRDGYCALHVRAASAAPAPPASRTGARAKGRKHHHRARARGRHRRRLK
jgi:hypothetical protein